MKKTLIYIISVIGLFSCDLDEVPVSGYGPADGRTWRAAG